ncbi:MAG: MTH938/NDUFAF3 family protein [Actinomycetota bacterium]
MTRIDDYRFGRIVVDGTGHDRDVIILPGEVVPNWWREQGHSLVTSDLDQVMDALPQHLIIGTGAYGQMKPRAEALEDLRRKGVEVEVMKTDAAVRRYEELDPKTTAAALHLTC